MLCPEKSTNNCNCVYQCIRTRYTIIVFDAKNLKFQWTENEVPGMTYGLSDRGWRAIEVFKPSLRSQTAFLISVWEGIILSGFWLSTKAC